VTPIIKRLELVVVPAALTKEMRLAGVKLRMSRNTSIDGVWAAMLAAAPAAAAPASGTEAALQYLVECLRDEDEGQFSCSKLVRYAFEGYEKALEDAK